MSVMKLQKVLFFIFLSFFSVYSTEAQLLKRLKAKVEQKLERKAERAIDKEIDDFSLPEQKEKTSNTKKDKKKDTEIAINNSNGSAVLKHEKQYGNYTIQKFGVAKLERTNDGVKIYGSWVTHGADIHDGYALNIPNGNSLLFNGDIPLKEQVILKIPQDASLKLSYDPIWEPKMEDENGYSTAVTKDYQSYNITSGEVVVDVISQKNVQFSFKGETQLESRIKNSNNSEKKYTSSFTSSSLNGSIDIGPILFLDSRRTENSRIIPHGTSMPEMTRNATTPGVYNFLFETKVKITDLDKSESFNMSYLLNPDKKYIGLMVDMAEYSDAEMQGESVIVMDGDDVHIFVETEGIKMRMSRGMMGGQQMQNPVEEMSNYDYTNLKKTGKSKTVLGAKCYEYVLSDKDVTIELWAAPSVNLPNWFIQNRDALEGHIMEYKVTSKDGRMKSETIAINDHINKTINPKEYRKMF